MSGHGARGTSDWAAGDAGDMGGRPGRVMPHISDLRVKAEETINAHEPIRRLLEKADLSEKQAGFLLEIRKPDTAYLEYLIASEIVVNILPHHKDFVTIQEDRGRLNHAYKELIKRVDAQHDRFARIKDIITNDNKRNGIRPTLPISEQRRSSLQPNGRLSSESSRAEGSRYSRPPSAGHMYNGRLSPRPSSSGGLSEQSSGRSSPVGRSGPARHRPPVNPKPEGLQGRAYNVTVTRNSGDPLSERFAKLRNPASSVDTRSSSSGNPVRMPSPSDYGAAPSPSIGSTGSSLGKPIGPRDMPSSSTGPPHPSKVPLRATIPVGMPKAPSPTYSPGRNLPTPLSINPPRTTARSIVGTGGRSSSMANSMSSQQSGDDSTVNGDHWNGSVQSKPSRRKSVHLPDKTDVNADKLYDYLRLYKVLLIDVRPRVEFDEGHIFAKSILCIEPTAVRNGMSAEELEDSLVLSPDEEQHLFHRRDHFDLVVCYDQFTSSTAFLDRHDRSRRECVLKHLFDALFVFNHEHPLRHHPILLSGGIDAWADLLGRSALATSNTAVRGIKGEKRPRPSSWLPKAGDPRYIENRRTREYNPLDDDEEKRWMNKAHHEEVAVDVRTSTEGENDEFDVEDATQHYTGYEDFLRRFPEANMVEGQSMTSPPPSQHPPPPSYPSPIPPVPSRPAPALPRPSYSGVHDRSVGTQSHSSHARHLPDYVPQKLQPQNVRLPRTGLVNFGVTCYMNSTIQCLSGTIPLSMMFVDDRWKSLVQRENWKGSRGVMPQYYADVIRALWKGDVGAVRPTSLRQLCARLITEWGADRQQDAKEFLDFLLEFLHEDFNTQWSRSPLHALTNEEEANRERLPKPYAASIEWGRYTHRDKSLISDLFAGQHSSRLRCTTCHHTSTTYEAFYSLSVEIPSSPTSRSSSGTTDIYDCLRSYCAQEMLSGDETWRCPRCRTEREATKQITLTRAPRHLVVHLKRFSAAPGETARKIRTPVEFPLRGLDLAPFMLPPLSPAEGDAAAARPGGAQEQVQRIRNDPQTAPPYRYDAYAVLRHLGTTLTSGHYIAMVRDRARGVWREFNDQIVSDFKPADLSPKNRLQNELAYIVFYERV